MKFAVTIFFLTILADLANAMPPDSLPSSMPPNVKVANWYNFSKAAYSLTFDDGLISQYEYLAPILEKYKLKATFFIITGALQENPELKPDWRHGYWHHFIELAGKGHELGSHTVTHKKLTTLKDGKNTSEESLQYELAQPIKTIQEKIPNYPVLSFAYPYVVYNEHVKEETLKLYPAARAAGRATNMPNDMHWGTLQAYILEYNGARTEESDLKQMTELQNFLQTGLIQEGGWGMYLAHDILPLSVAIEATDSWHPVSTESFEQFAAWLKTKQESNELWVAPMGAVTRYAKEKENLMITQKENTDRKLIFELNDQLPDDLYDQVLTIEVGLPQGWNKVKIVQGRKKETKTVKDGKIQINALPCKDPLEILKIE